MVLALLPAAPHASPRSRARAESPRTFAADPGLPPALAMPIEGLAPSDLRDSFAEGRGGHRHEAIDIPEPRGTPVVAVDDGVVEKIFESVPGGHTVYQFNLNRTYCYYYAHLDRYAEGLTQGRMLRRGDRVGYVGTSGNAPKNAPHLHFAISRLGREKRWWEGTPIDPFPILTSSPPRLP